MAYKTKGAFACLLSVFITLGILNGYITEVGAVYPYVDYNYYQQGIAPGAFHQSGYPLQVQQQFPHGLEGMQQSSFSQSLQQQSAFPPNSQQAAFAEASALTQQQQFGQSNAAAGSGNGIMMMDLQSGEIIAGSQMGQLGSATTRRKVQRKELTRTPDAYDVLFSTSLLLLMTKFFDFIL